MPTFAQCLIQFYMLFHTECMIVSVRKLSLNQVQIYINNYKVCGNESKWKSRT